MSASALTLVLAAALDDDAPDNICPGCGFNIAGWFGHDQHYIGGPFVGRQVASGPRLCPWTSDMLSARTFRRNLIREAS